MGGRQAISFRQSVNTYLVAFNGFGFRLQTNKKERSHDLSFLLVRMTGLEPARLRVGT